jgi:hypothetical protein
VHGQHSTSIAGDSDERFPAQDQDAASIRIGRPIRERAFGGAVAAGDQSPSYDIGFRLGAIVTVRPSPYRRAGGTVSEMSTATKTVGARWKAHAPNSAMRDANGSDEAHPRTPCLRNPLYQL